MRLITPGATTEGAGGENNNDSKEQEDDSSDEEHAAAIVGERAGAIETPQKSLVSPRRATRSAAVKVNTGVAKSKPRQPP